MTKRSVIWLSVLLVLVVLTGVLFGTIFVLRRQNVTILGDTPVEVTKEQILYVADFKKGQSIFMLDKDKATTNIEQAYPNIKVIQIKTISLFEIDIRIRARHEMYYTEFGENYYILDEDLKVLKINKPIEETPATKPENLIHIESGELNIDETTTVSSFVGSSYQTKIAQDLYHSMITVVTKGDGENEEYLNREDVKETIIDVKFEEYNTFEKIIVTTKYGVKLDIENPTDNLQNKINICFSTINLFLNSQEVETQEKVKSGTIKIYYDLNGNQQCIYTN